MGFLAGSFLIDAPASALNNAGNEGNGVTDNTVAVKSIRTKNGYYPYVSAQAYRFWLRRTLEKNPEIKWNPSPIFRENKIAYTDANPIEYWDDDLFGYMRAQSKKANKGETNFEGITPASADITRVSPFKVSTLVSLNPVSLTGDFGTMSRHEGDPVPHEHQFYRAILKSLFSLDLKEVGTFSYFHRTGYKNLDEVRIQLANDKGLEHLEDLKSYRLPIKKRIERIDSLLKAMSLANGGAKQAIHYTDVTPVVLVGAFIKGGNNPLNYLIEADEKGNLSVKADTVEEIVKVWHDQFLSPIYIGWNSGFQSKIFDELKEILGTLQTNFNAFSIRTGHPREMLLQMVSDLHENPSWLE